MSEKVVEICCGSYYDALEAYAGGAKRIELNSALHMGGLTPSLATLQLVKQNTDLKVICMVRPRGAGFCYEKEDVEVMFADAKMLLEHGADGLAFGFLNEDKTVNEELTKKMVELIHSYGKEAVFHRAIDVCADMEKGVAALVRCHVDRVLTSGGYAKAPEGTRVIASLYDIYHDKITFLAGCGIHADNAKYIMDNAKVSEIHSSCKTWKHDATTSHFGVNYSYAGVNKYDAVDRELVQELLESIK